ncbi:hypothetical protein GSY71_16875 [Pusillimonas sp. TS35]|uniref:ATP synthase subunit I n=1 Tax=Paracandidimonas lactea TaxID=2895524 RepID=UPI001367DDCD|nr:ATP synthase subunit I [Paracandidimonas lactea]MYN14815.1 hypothetical protein [Pusillimonas sp. TS35]
MDTNTVAGSGKPGETRGFGAEKLVLTEQDRAAIHLRASTGLLRTLAAQAVMLAVAVLVCGLVAGSGAAISALIGGGAYLVPNSLFALRLLAGLWGPARSDPLTFFWGEAFKLASSLAVLGLAGWLGSGWLSWPAALVGLLFVLKGYVLLLLFRKLP